jgi:hypothetical protein
LVAVDGNLEALPALGPSKNFPIPFGLDFGLDVAISRKFLPAQGMESWPFRPWPPPILTELSPRISFVVMRFI